MASCAVHFWLVLVWEAKLEEVENPTRKKRPAGRNHDARLPDHILAGSEESDGPEDADDPEDVDDPEATDDPDEDVDDLEAADDPDEDVDVLEKTDVLEKEAVLEKAAVLEDAERYPERDAEVEENELG